MVLLSSHVPDAMFGTCAPLVARAPFTYRCGPLVVYMLPAWPQATSRTASQARVFRPMLARLTADPWVQDVGRERG